MATDRKEAAKRAWETIRARKAAGVSAPPAPKASKAPAKDEQAARLHGLLEEWLKPTI